MASTEERLTALESQLMRLAEQYPVAVCIAVLDALINFACGDNPALRNYRRLLIVRDVVGTLAKIGIE